MSKLQGWGMFQPGDLVRLKLKGQVQRGFWHFGGMQADGTLALRQMKMASWRSLDPAQVVLIDHDARWAA